jgi:uncharacterized protein
MDNFTPGPSLFGGILIGLSASWLYWALGRIAGITGIVGGLFNRRDAAPAWRLAFVVGMAAGGAAMSLIAPQTMGPMVASYPVLAIAGVLVGFGTRLSNGCTSGHGVCGLSRLAPRSFVAVPVFMAVAGLTVFLVHQFGGALTGIEAQP